MVEIITTPSCTVVVALSLSEAESLVGSLRRLVKIDGMMHSNLVRMYRKMHTYLVEVHNYGS